MEYISTDGHPKLSVILPIYNVEKYLPRCMDSVLNQTLTDIEIIAVNDGSTDRSCEIITEYSEKDNRVIALNKTNGGYGSAINKGLENAHGLYVGIVETDDWIAVDMFERLFQKALSTDADIVKAGFYNAYSSTNFEEEETFKWLKPPSDVFSGTDYPYILGFKPTVWSAIYKTDFINKHKIRMVETPGASFQDLPFTFELFSLADKITLIEDPLYFYFQENQESSIRNIKKPFIVFDHFEYINQFLLQHNEIKENLLPMKWRAEYTHYLWNFERIEKKHRKAFFSKLHKKFSVLSDEILTFIQFTDRDKKFIYYIVNNKYSQFINKYRYDYIINYLKTFLNNKISKNLRAVL